MNVIGEVKKNSLEKIIVSTEDYHGHKFVNVRIWYKDDNGEYKPSKKGIAVSKKALPEIVEMMVKAGENL